jgi:hypothetical protein
MSPRQHIRDWEQVDAFFTRQTASGWEKDELNWHLPFLLEDARATFTRRYRLSPPTGPSAYARFIQREARRVVASHLEAHPALAERLQAVWIHGSVALGCAQPFHSWVEEEPLPPHTLNLFADLYTWLFAFLGKSPDLSRTRFLDADLASRLKLRFILSEAGELSASDLHRQLREGFIEGWNFSPPLEIQLTRESDLEPNQVLSAHSLSGWAYTHQALAQLHRELDPRAFYHAYRETVAESVEVFSSPRHRSNFGRPDFLERADRPIQAYLALRENPDAVLALAGRDGAETETRSWQEQNHTFFQHLLAGDFDAVMVEDATRGLGDQKGIDKENRFTLLRVLGLRTGGQTVPAHHMMFKLRGLSHYRGDVNNWVDLIKEHHSYAHLHQADPPPLPFIPDFGPLLLTCEKFQVPFSRMETRHWMGFFLEELPVAGEGAVVTARVRHLSDFWDLEDSQKRVLRAAEENHIQLDQHELTEELRQLATWLWTQGTPVDYCDLVIYLGPERTIQRVRMIDLERLSFGELVGERHLVIDAWIDLKTHLRKTDWYRVLLNVYRSREDPKGIDSLSQIRPSLRQESRRRALIISGLRLARSAAYRLPTSSGDRLWRALLTGLVRFASKDVAESALAPHPRGQVKTDV